MRACINAKTKARCLNDMVLDVNSANHLEHIYNFRRNPAGSAKSTSLLNSQLCVGDPIVISSTEGHINLGMGFVRQLDSSSISVQLTSSLRHVPHKDVDFDEGCNQVFRNGNHKATYRIDKDELSAGMALMRQNIVNLVAREEEGGDVKRRRLIVDLEKPSFVPAQSIDPEVMSGLNPAQRIAVEKVMSGKVLNRMVMVSVTRN